MRIALYIRVSTKRQKHENQQLKLGSSPRT
jgi:DNA invertase Pin-like site-specific DNA recombinase